MNVANSSAGGRTGPPSISLLPLVAKGAGQGSQGQCAGCSPCRSACANAPLTQAASAADDRNALLGAPQHVLSTLERDGSRRWLRPRVAAGRHWNRRRWLGYMLIVFFVALPHLRIAGKPPLLLDIPARQLIVLGQTFLPTDTLLLALGILSVLLVIMSVTTLSGRVWCGWACPQTVYMEFLFRPIDRLFEGTVGRGGKPRRLSSGWLAIGRFAIYLVLAMALAHTFLSYFVGTDRLAMWIRSSPRQHPFAFFVMASTTIAMLFDFLVFREQMCVIACPYGRFQSVMLDRRSLIVGYDEKRGEPRGHLQKVKSFGENDLAGHRGDCVDCKLCVSVCPTGIDIRDGLQMECIHCTQCIDACDSVMDKIHKPRGLIRYSAQDGLCGKPSTKWRMRLLLYPSLSALLFAALIGIVWNKSPFDASLLRGGGNPFTSLGVGRIHNSLKLRLVNRSTTPQTYHLAISRPEDATLEVMEPEKLLIGPGKSVLIPLSVTFPARLMGQGGNVWATLIVSDGDGQSRHMDCQLVGPMP